MLHPATVHFAMVLPVVAATLGISYLISKKEIMSKIAARSTLLAALAMIGVWYTGSQAGPQIFDYLSPVGKHELLEHKQLGLYLAIAMSIIALLQIVGCKLKKFGLEALAIVLLIGAMFTTFWQGKHGGEIAYNQGMPFKAYMIGNSLLEANKAANATEDDSEKVEAYEDALDDIQSTSDEVDAIYGNKKHMQVEEDDE
jgi:uncharacterized membrane protein